MVDKNTMKNIKNKRRKKKFLKITDKEVFFKYKSWKTKSAYLPLNLTIAGASFSELYYCDVNWCGTKQMGYICVVPLSLTCIRIIRWYFESPQFPPVRKFFLHHCQRFLCASHLVYQQGFQKYRSIGKTYIAATKNLCRGPFLSKSRYKISTVHRPLRKYSSSSVWR